MIKFENTFVSGWEAAIRGMRNPMNSWDKSDSGYRCSATEPPRYIIGSNDFKLMKSLVRAGSDHSKFMRMINVTVDITAPMYWWKEFDTYKVGSVRNSCSTMHKIQAKEFTLEDFSCEHLYSSPVDETRTFSLEKGDVNGCSIQAFYTPLDILKATIEILNACREDFLNNNSKSDWWQMIQLLPSSYNQRSTVQLNYAVLRNMYHSRKNHKLDEWSADFCNWVKTLPYSELITDDFKGVIMVGDKVNQAAEKNDLKFYKDIFLSLCNISDIIKESE